MTRIGILGAGAFGTALGIALARAGRDVTLWARDAEHVAEMNRQRENTRRLPGHSLPPALEVTADLDRLDMPHMLLAVPTQAAGAFLRVNGARFSGRTLVVTNKGLDLQSGAMPFHQVSAINAQPAILSGPSFATDLAKGLPTALTIAAPTDAQALALQDILATDTLRLYRSHDLIGVTLGGALKNVMALACGMAMGAGLGESARAALMTRGYAEMTRFAVSMGGKPDTLAGLSGFGDLVLTCTSEKSRNFRHGMSLGKGDTPAQATVEGVATAQAVHDIARRNGADLPITGAVAAVLAGHLTIPKAMESLLSRPLKQE